MLRGARDSRTQSAALTKHSVASCATAREAVAMRAKRRVRRSWRRREARAPWNVGSAQLANGWRDRGRARAEPPLLLDWFGGAWSAASCCA